jgi:hypothetical protein
MTRRIGFVRCADCGDENYFCAAAKISCFAHLHLQARFARASVEAEIFLARTG